MIESRKPTATASVRRDGYAPIGSYAAIGDGRTVALVCLDGSIDWWSLPTMDAPPAFAAILDPEQGGTIRMAPRRPATVERRYLGRTAVLETVFTTAEGVVTITDSVNLLNGRTLPWNELCRRVEALSGRVEMQWEVVPGNRFGHARPWVTERKGVPELVIGDQCIGVVAEGIGVLELTEPAVRGSFVAEKDSLHVLGLVSTDAEPLFVATAADLVGRVESTRKSWGSWADRVLYEGPWKQAVLDSARALKLLIYAPTGAIAAAPTTSLPEAIGGSRNFDYRFAWVRDMSFVIQSLIRLGLHEDGHRALSWLLATVQRTAPDLHVFYSLDGDLAEEEAEIPLSGYRGSQPVHAGNGAAGQSQLGTFGDLLDAVWLYCEGGNLLDDSTADLIERCANRVCDIWSREDSGIWELGERRHYTSSKISCWAALDRACQLADSGQVASRHLNRWAVERDRIADWVGTNCWSSSKNTFTFYAGTERLDAAVLRAGRVGFDRGERLSSTIDAVRSALGRGPLLYRYSGMADQEGAFLACSFWLAEALAYCNRIDEARELMDELMALRNDVGLMSEEMDPHTREFLGNFPLGLTHLSLVGAATALASTAAGRP